MRLRRIGVITTVLLSSMGCHRRYVASGPRGDFDFSGSYDVGAQPIGNWCSDVSMREVRSRLDVEHGRGEVRLTVVFEGDPYLSSLKRNGEFASQPVRRERAGTIETVKMRGRFRDSTISASLEVNRDAVRPVLPGGRIQAAACRYHINVSGRLIAEP